MARTKKSFGNTWWGQQWLNALGSIDYSNRLPRGRTYARKGTVKDLDIQENRILADVQGSSYYPYNVDIQIPRLTAKEKQIILDLITSNPLHLSKLLNRELPTGLYQDCQNRQIQLFPNSWNDLSGGCSCPDWAVPCKHMAAVLYLIADEIDKNPFATFQLKGFDLLNALTEAGTTVKESTQVPIVQQIALWQEFSDAATSFQFDEDLFKQLDFTQIPNCQSNLLHLLKEKPLFYHEKDFKKVLQQAYKVLARSIEKRQINIREEEELVSAICLSTESIEILLDEESVFLRATFRNLDQEAIKTFDEVEPLMDWLAQCPSRLLPQFSDALRGLYLCFQTALQLIIQSAIIPQLIEFKPAHYFIRWLPARLNQEVLSFVNKIGQLCPPDLLFMVRDEVIFEPHANAASTDLISFWIDQFIHQAMKHERRFPDDAINRLFFRGYLENFGDFENNDHPATIQLWLNNFFIAEKSFVPVLQVKEEEAGFLINIAIEDKAQPMKAPTPLKRIFSAKKYDKLRMEVMRDLAMVVDHFPKLQNILASRGEQSLRASFKEFADILFNTIPVIRLFGIKILLPKGLQKLVRPQAQLALESKESTTSVSMFNINDLLDFDWQIAMGDQLVRPSEFFKMMKQYAGIVKLNDQYVYFDEKEIQKLLNKIEQPPQLSATETLQAVLSEGYEGQPIQLDESARGLMKELLDVDKTPLPEGLQATLRPYQKRGYEWLYKNARLGIGSIIADDMGLGKTLQVITLLLKLKEEGAFKNSKGLLVVPTTLLTNWQQEIQRFAPNLIAHIYHGPSRKLAPLKTADLLITTYGVIRTENTALAKHKWLTLVIDEAQAIKNPNTIQTKSIKKIAAPIKVAMSGTPVENRLSEYWSIFDFTNAGYLGKSKQFAKEYAKPIELERDQQQLDRFIRITQPFILRRLKSDKSIIKDLPDKIEQDQFCQLTKEQAGIYQNVMDNTLRGIEGAEGIQRKGLVLKLITALKQICNHPSQFLKKGAPDPALSGKASRLIPLLQNILDSGEKALIFTQYQSMGKILAEMIETAFGLQAAFLHGGVSRKKRDEMVQHFQTQRSARILLLSLKAGGTGLNLTAASHVIHYDLWWNPAVEAQATDRAYRIGQQKNVQVHRFITSGTFEEKIDQMIKAKKELANLTVSTGEKWIGELSDQDLKELVSLK